jgi:glycosyltransferase involved in cell wall biosynthesis
MNKNVAIIGSVGLPARYGGWETLVDHLTKNLSGEYSFTVFCSSKRYEARLESYNGASLEYVNIDANGIQSIFYDLVSMIRSFKKADTLLILGVSGCLFLPLLKLFSSSRFIVNIDGLEWKRDKWGRFAKWFLKLSEYFAIRFAHIVITDNKALQSYVLEKYGVSSKLISYGADHVRYEVLNENILEKYSFLKKKYSFGVCRIEPENNLDIILSAFSEFGKFDLVIVGNWNNSEYAKNLRMQYENCSNLHLLDPIYEQTLLNQLRSNCNIYVHGHSAGGTNPSLVEAMHLGLSIVSFDVSYNRETTHNRAVYFDSKAQLINILTQSEGIDWLSVAKDMRLIAKSEYTWLTISSQYANLF